MTALFTLHIHAHTLSISLFLSFSLSHAAGGSTLWSSSLDPRTYTRTHKYKHTQSHKYTFTYTQTHVHMHTHVRAQTLSVFLSHTSSTNSLLQVPPPSLIKIYTRTHIQPIADRVALNLEIISKNFQFGTRRTRILMGCTMYYLVLIVNPIGRILVRSKSSRNNLEIQCHPICNRLYHAIKHTNTHTHTHNAHTLHTHTHIYTQTHSLSVSIHGG